MPYSAPKVQDTILVQATNVTTELENFYCLNNQFYDETISKVLTKWPSLSTFLITKFGMFALNSSQVNRMSSWNPARWAQLFE